jgi:lipopolysaccharide biosynthesis glycosyltransferase
MVNCDIDKAVEKFKDFPLVTCKRVDNITNKKHFAFDIDIITAKFKIIDEVESEYFLSLDGDLFFFGSIEDTLIEYPTTVAGVTEKLINRPYLINAGFLIMKKPKVSMMNVFEKRWKDSLTMPEQEVLSAEFLHDMTIIDEKYNTTWSTNLFRCKNPIVLHYAIKTKPWSDVEETCKYGFYYPKFMFRLTIKYIEYALRLNLDADFKEKLERNSHMYKCMLGEI